MVTLPSSDGAPIFMGSAEMIGTAGVPVALLHWGSQSVKILPGPGNCHLMGSSESLRHCPCSRSFTSEGSPDFMETVFVSQGALICKCLRWRDILLLCSGSSLPLVCGAWGDGWSVWQGMRTMG